MFASCLPVHFKYSDPGLDLALRFLSVLKWCFTGVLTVESDNRAL